MLMLYSEAMYGKVLFGTALFGKVSKIFTLIM